MRRMKGFSRWLFLLFLVFLIYPFPASGESIREFSLELALDASGRGLVTEHITWDFEDEWRHGIIRHIPVSYHRNGFRYRIRLKVVKVTDEDGRPYRYKVYTSGGKVHIKIGDPEKTITGAHRYNIQYTVQRAVGFFPTYDEIYWNVTGVENEVPIHQAESKFYTLFQVQRNLADSVCYTGAYGSELQNCRMEIFYGERGLILTVSTGYLSPREGLTVALKLPKGLIRKPSSAQALTYFLADNWYLLLPIFVLIGMLYFWGQYGKELPLPPIAVQYEPPAGFTPGEIGVVVDERADIIDITSSLIDLAVKGYIKIREVESTRFLFFSSRDYEFILLKSLEQDEQLKDHERYILRGIFGVAGKPETSVFLSSLRNQFYVHLPNIRDALYSEVVEAGLFEGDPQAVRITWLVGGIVFFSLIGFLAFYFWQNPVVVIPSGVSALIVVGFSYLMPRKPFRGVEVLALILGFKEFLVRVEKDHLERMHREDPLLFDKYLPYAMVLGVADEWAEHFRDLYRDPPSWYESPDYARGFYPVAFVHDLGRGLNTMGATLSSVPSRVGAGGGGSAFGGGGFSGGGFGGGGTSSW